MARIMSDIIIFSFPIKSYDLLKICISLNNIFYFFQVINHVIWQKYPIKYEFLSFLVKEL